MGKVIGGILGLVMVGAFIFGIYSLIAWGLSAGIEFVFGYHLGFWRALIGIFVVGTISNIIFGGIKIRLGREEK